MIKKEKAIVLDMLQSLKEAVAYMFTSKTIISQCKEVVLAIFDIIYKEKIVNNNLEQLKNIICNIVEQKIIISEDEAIGIISQVEYVEIFIENLSTKYTMVFLPYKASMWDSLESVYLAAVADPMCIPYVIPIPYFDKTKDGNVAQSHYEGDIFPKNIPITLFTDYDIQAEKPDVIFIHNPYDEFNLVTTVPHKYYSYNLKNCTNCLVYLPYYIGEGDKDNIEIIKTSCANHVDIIIALSEKAKELYKQAFPKEIYKKVYALGSPKLDKAINDKKENQSIPKYWQEKIGDKKVILYNTSIGAMLKYKNDYIKKLKYNFSFFEKFKKDITVIWRPHPLINAAYISLREEFFQEYIDVKEWFLNNKIGILDETPDCHMAMAISDAYFGDYSSVANMYAITTKPVMIQNPLLVEEKSQQEAATPMFEAAAHIENKLYFSSGTFNGLFSVDLNGDNFEFLGRFPQEDYNKVFLFKTVQAVGNILYFIPYLAKNICTYNIKTGEFGEIRIESRFNVRYIASVKILDNIYMIPALAGKIAKLDTKTNNIIYNEDYISKINYLIKDKNKTVFTTAVFENNKLWLGIAGISAILEVNIETFKSKIHKLNVENTQGVRDISVIGDELWIITENNFSIIRYNYITHDKVIYNELKSNGKIYTNTPNSYYKIKYINEYIYLVPKNCNYILKLNKNGEILQELAVANTVKQYLPYRNMWVSRITDVCEIKGELYFFPGRICDIIKTDRDLKNVSLISVDARKYNISAQTLICNEDIYADGTKIGWYYYREGFYAQAKEFFSLVANDGYSKEKREGQKNAYKYYSANIDATSGEKIYNLVKIKTDNS